MPSLDEMPAALSSVEELTTLIVSFNRWRAPDDRRAQEAAKPRGGGEPDRGAARRRRRDGVRCRPSTCRTTPPSRTARSSGRSLKRASEPRRRATRPWVEWMHRRRAPRRRATRSPRRPPTRRCQPASVCADLSAEQDGQIRSSCNTHADFAVRLRADAQLADSSDPPASRQIRPAASPPRSFAQPLRMSPPSAPSSALSGSVAGQNRSSGKFGRKFVHVNAVAAGGGAVEDMRGRRRPNIASAWAPPAMGGGSPHSDEVIAPSRRPSAHNSDFVRGSRPREADDRGAERATAAAPTAQCRAAPASLSRESRKVPSLAHETDSTVDRRHRRRRAPSAASAAAASSAAAPTSRPSVAASPSRRRRRASSAAAPLRRRLRRRLLAKAAAAADFFATGAGDRARQRPELLAKRLEIVLSRVERELERLGGVGHPRQRRLQLEERAVRVADHQAVRVGRPAHRRHRRRRLRSPLPAA